MELINKSDWSAFILSMALLSLTFVYGCQIIVIGFMAGLSLLAIFMIFCLVRS